jgi:hypothetical protein
MRARQPPLIGAADTRLGLDREATVSPRGRRPYSVHMTRALAALVVLALAVPTVSAAQAPQTNAPPGNSGIDEYLETVPGAGGNKRPRPPGQRKRRGTDALTAAQRARLERLGPDGKALADAVEATADTPAPASRRKNEIAASRSEGRSPLTEVLSTVSGSDGGSGMGVVLPALLIAALLAALLLVLLRRRAAS